MLDHWSRSESSQRNTTWLSLATYDLPNNTALAILIIISQRVIHVLLYSCKEWIFSGGTPAWKGWQCSSSCLGVKIKDSGLTYDVHEKTLQLFLAAKVSFRVHLRINNFKNAPVSVFRFDFHQSLDSNLLVLAPFLNSIWLSSLFHSSWYLSGVH